MLVLHKHDLMRALVESIDSALLCGRGQPRGIALLCYPPLLGVVVTTPLNRSARIPGGPS